MPGHAPTVPLSPIAGDSWTLRVAGWWDFPTMSTVLETFRGLHTCLGAIVRQASPDPGWQAPGRGVGQCRAGHFGGCEWAGGAATSYARLISNTSPMRLALSAKAVENSGGPRWRPTTARHRIEGCLRRLKRHMSPRRLCVSRLERLEQLARQAADSLSLSSQWIRVTLTGAGRIPNLSRVRAATKTDKEGRHNSRTDS